MKKLNKSSVVYVARQILANSKEKYVGVGCSESDFTEQKNSDIVDLCIAFMEMGKKIALVNFDPTFSADIEFIDATDCTEKHIYDVEKAVVGINADEYDKVILNLCPLSSKGYLLDADSKIKEVVLTLKYGRATYSNVENALGCIKQNGVKLIGVLTH